VKRAAATVCACCFAALAQTAAGRAAPITLVSPNIPGPAPPPLAGGPQLSAEPGEVRVPGTLANVEAVRAGLAQDGSPVSVVVVQRMTIKGLGDFRFVVPAPATKAVPAFGSRSLPGLRQAGIVWQGFSPGMRQLGARITLRTSRAAGGLPMRVAVTRQNGFTRVRLENRSAKQFVITFGSAPLPSLRTVLARVRQELDEEVTAGHPLPMVFEQVQGTPTVQKIIAVEAPLHVSGTMSVVGGRSAKVSTTLGGDHPQARVVRLRGVGRLTLSLTATFDHDRRRLLPTAGRLGSAANPLLVLQTALARTAVALQYQQYLTSPKPGSASSTTYRYVTAPARVAAPTSAPGGGDDDGPSALVFTLIAIGGLGLLGGLVVLWAHM
jgi:hypothetical protein